MPLFDPRTPVELNAAKKLLEGAGTLSDIVGNLYNKYAPAPVKEGINYWNNTPDPLPGPYDNALKSASIVVPWLLMRGGKTAAKAKKIVEKKFGVRDVEELMNIPYTRWQREAVDVPVSRGRHGVFVTPEIGHSRADPDIYNTTISSPGRMVEGGDVKVQGVAKIANPLFIDRDVKGRVGSSHIGYDLNRALFGERKAKAIRDFSQIASDPIKIKMWGNLKGGIYDRVRVGQKQFNRLFTPKEQAEILANPSGNIALEQAIGLKQAENVGYDSIVNLRHQRGSEPKLSDRLRDYIWNKQQNVDSQIPNIKYGEQPLKPNQTLKNLEFIDNNTKADMEGFRKAFNASYDDASPYRIRLYKKLKERGLIGEKASIYNDAAWRIINHYHKRTPDLTPSMAAGPPNTLSEFATDAAAKYLKTLPKPPVKFDANQLILLDPELRRIGRQALKSLGSSKE